ncbi:MAG: hypothetical protein HY647_04175 [Acidobacteria bacterium]|nr:hypothetical protein [Acidobacteriota bacterium]
MKKISVLMAALVWMGFIGGWTPFAGAGRSRPAVSNPNLLEQQYEQAPDPRQRIEIAMDLMNLRLKLLRAAYRAGSGEQEQSAHDYLEAVGLLEKAVVEASHAGSSKKAEVFLRRQGKELENLRTGVPSLERQALDEILSRVVNLREAVLYSILNPRKASAKP